MGFKSLAQITNPGDKQNKTQSKQTNHHQDPIKINLIQFPTNSCYTHQNNKITKKHTYHIIISELIYPTTH